VKGLAVVGDDALGFLALALVGSHALTTIP